MNFIWDNEPVAMSEIALFAAKELTWKKTTTYTVVKRLCDREITRKSGESKAMHISSIVSREEAQLTHADYLVKKMYNNSLKMFCVAFMKDKNVSETKMEELQRLIEEIEE